MGQKPHIEGLTKISALAAIEAPRKRRRLRRKIAHGYDFRVKCFVFGNVLGNAIAGHMRYAEMDEVADRQRAQAIAWQMQGGGSSPNLATGEGFEGGLFARSMDVPSEANFATFQDGSGLAFAGGDYMVADAVPSVPDGLIQ